MWLLKDKGMATEKAVIWHVICTKTKDLQPIRIALQSIQKRSVSCCTAKITIPIRKKSYPIQFSTDEIRTRFMQSYTNALIVVVEQAVSYFYRLVTSLIDRARRAAMDNRSFAVSCISLWTAR